jgi:hypothetical protein
MTSRVHRLSAAHRADSRSTHSVGVSITGGFVYADTDSVATTRPVFLRRLDRARVVDGAHDRPVNWRGTENEPHRAHRCARRHRDAGQRHPRSASTPAASCIVSYSRGVILKVLGAASNGVDFDDDGKADLVVCGRRAETGSSGIRPATSRRTSFVSGGVIGDVPVPGDYDGDGTTDLALWRPSSGFWFIFKSSTSFTTSLAPVWPVERRPRAGRLRRRRRDR